MQFDKGSKGFSFSKEGPLDMRMDPTADLTAEVIVNKWPEEKLGEILRDLGEEPHWRRISKTIVSERRRAPIKTTTQLAELVKSAGGGRGKKLHPATLVFQALRICVNRELESLQEGIRKAMTRLNPAGRLGVISFHSLEDRIVKNLFKGAATPPPGFRKGRDQFVPMMRTLTKKPLVPSLSEMRSNPRSRSAKMRFAERV